MKEEFLMPTNESIVYLAMKAVTSSADLEKSEFRESKEKTITLKRRKFNSSKSKKTRRKKP